MNDLSQEDGLKKTRGGRALVFIAMVCLFAIGAGFALGYSGKLNLSGLIGQEPGSQPEHIVFLDLPQVLLSLPGDAPKTLAMSITIEANARHIKEVKQVSPRILDSINVFLSQIDPVAFERRGILEIVKGEMATRVENILGSDGFRDLLIMEFRIQ